MTVKEMKEILVSKLRDEGWTDADHSLVSIKTDKDATWIAIKDYDHIKYKMTQETDDYFGKIVQITEYWKIGDKLEQGDCIAFVDSKRDFKIDTALIYLGYHIGTTF